MNVPFLVFAYFGPETVLPMTSVIATVVGIFMMFGRTMFRLVFRGRWFRRPVSPPAGRVPAPHVLRKESSHSTVAQR